MADKEYPQDTPVPMRVVYAYRAYDGGGKPAPITTIKLKDILNDEAAERTLGYPGTPNREWEARAKAFYISQASEIEIALWEALPGGTYDALMALMMNRKSALYRVRHRDPEEKKD